MWLPLTITDCVAPTIIWNIVLRYSLTLNLHRGGGEGVKKKTYHPKEEGREGQGLNPGPTVC